MRHIFGIGEIVMDILFRGHRPTAAVPGGSTFNSLISLARAGVPCALLSETGDDPVGRRCRSFMQQNGVETRYVLEYAGRQTPLSIAAIGDGGDAQYEFYAPSYGERRPFELPEVAAGDAVLFGSYYALRADVRAEVVRFLRYARSRGAMLYYDVNFRPAHAAERQALMPALQENLALAHVVRASADDCAVLYGQTDAAAVYAEHIAPHAPLFVQTRGGEGLSVHTPEGCLQFDVQPCRVVSTVGAGDNFNAGFLFGILEQGLDGTRLDRLDAATWGRLVARAQGFAANVCGSTDNYIDTALGRELARTLAEHRARG